MIHVIDSYDLLQKIMGRSFDLFAWKKYADSVSPTIFAKCFEDISAYDFDRQCIPILNQALMNSDQVHAAHDSFVLIMRDIGEKAQHCLEVNTEADIVFYFGLCNGAGWATELDGRPAVLIGVEKIIELSWCDRNKIAGVIYHELGHLWHFQNRKEPSFENIDSRLWQIYTEGVAMFAEQLLMEDGNFFHQYDLEWLSWCNENRTKLFNEYLRRIQTDYSVQDFFGDWCSYSGHSDVGYYLGCELVHHLSGSMNRQELFNFSVRQIEVALSELVK